MQVQGKKHEEENVQLLKMTTSNRQSPDLRKSLGLEQNACVASLGHGKKQESEKMNDDELVLEGSEKEQQWKQRG